MTRALADTSLFIACESGRRLTEVDLPDELAISVITGSPRSRSSSSIVLGAIDARHLHADVREVGFGQQAAVLGLFERSGHTAGPLVLSLALIRHSAIPRSACPPGQESCACRTWHERKNRRHYRSACARASTSASVQMLGPAQRSTSRRWRSYVFERSAASSTARSPQRAAPDSSWSLPSPT